jgi:hypothetical protein
MSVIITFIFELATLQMNRAGRPLRGVDRPGAGAKPKDKARVIKTW